MTETRKEIIKEVFDYFEKQYPQLYTLYKLNNKVFISPPIAISMVKTVINNGKKKFGVD